jgi:hypothetical protein
MITAGLAAANLVRNPDANAKLPVDISTGHPEAFERHAAPSAAYLL